MNNGQTTAHARSGHPMCCPVLATVRQLLMHGHTFCLHGRAPTRAPPSWLPSTHPRVGMSLSMLLTSQQAYGCLPLWSAQSLEWVRVNTVLLVPSGLVAMALMAGKCDDKIIKLLGRWRSNTMMDYCLHEQSLPIFKRLAGVMYTYNNGHHSFLPSETVPIVAVG